MVAVRKLAQTVVRFRWPLLSAGAAGWLALTVHLRSLHLSFEALSYATLTLFGSMLILTFAANAIVRFRGTRDRISLILALGFALAGLIETSGSFEFFTKTGADMLSATVPLSWMVSRTVLAILVIVALVVERQLPKSRDTGREIAAAFFIVAAAGYLTSAAYLISPWQISIHSKWPLARQWDLIPAAIFCAAAIGFRNRLRIPSSAFDKSLYWMAWLGVAAHLAATQSENLLDGPSMLAQALKVASYGVVLGGALIDNARLFDKVRSMAVSDSLTGLANYRTLIESLGNEVERSNRSGRPFSVLLLDLDRLKSVNDQYGHLVGTRAIMRVAHVIKIHSRVTDTAARYGGDEFALVLPEAGGEMAERVAKRIRERLAGELETPRLTVSVGVAVYPADGDTVEKLLGAADEDLYRMKGSSGHVQLLTKKAVGV